LFSSPLGIVFILHCGASACFLLCFAAFRDVGNTPVLPHATGAGTKTDVASCLQVLQAYVRQFPELAEAAQVVVSTSGNGAHFLVL